ncbi:MAG: hypothetical protein OXH27_10780 [Gammaproteobacteria bacterium]|nr:hypothetical protein [Gammaproteobacteria bacterium]MCY3650625.1 hypothetical protein [Acidimicrobiaceae bacterium]MDE0514711.1 hypothetical protein [Acidimicrobiaceae bacterium]MDE0656722.1 hypothetical protein [Acidimicrobiaceae bacterium]
MSDPETPDDEIADRWWEQRAEAFEAWADSVEPADLQPADTRALQAIAKLTELRTEVDAALLEAVREARGKRHKWAEIGAMLGVTRQAAEHKYGPRLDDVPIEGSRTVIDADEWLDADQRLIDAYRRLPEDAALSESVARFAARTTPEW